MLNFKRVAYRELLWKDDTHRKPLVLGSTRQIAKSFNSITLSKNDCDDYHTVYNQV